MKREGHTHTEFCPHGSGEDVELFILKAIQLGFTEYSITEHNPLPKHFLNSAAGEPEALVTGGININDVEPYLKKMHRLKKKYENEIKIHVGFEVDYLPGFEDWTTDFLNEYGEQIDDSILSLHFLEGNEGFRSIDYSPQDYDTGIVQYYGSFQKAQEKYYSTLIQLMDADLGFHKPKRIGHISLCQKFQKYFEQEETGLSLTSLNLIDQILDKAKGKQYELDFNTAGLYKEYCGETYPPVDVMKKVREKGIQCVYGSDAHSLDAVGRGYEHFLRLYGRERSLKYAGISQ
jgi:histidinol-phosphatase (PHP family)